MAKLVSFIDTINFSNLTEGERDLLFSEPLRRDPISRQIQGFMENFMKEWSQFLHEQANDSMQRVASVYKLRFGPKEFKELLKAG